MFVVVISFETTHTKFEFADGNKEQFKAETLVSENNV